MLPAGDRIDQTTSIIGLRIPVDLFCVTALNDASFVHDQYPVADMPDHHQIMGDEKGGKAECFAQVNQKVEDLCLHTDIERRNGLIQDEKGRIQRQRARDTDPLTLTP